MSIKPGILRIWILEILYMNIVSTVGRYCYDLPDHTIVHMGHVKNNGTHPKSTYQGVKVGFYFGLETDMCHSKSPGVQSGSSFFIFSHTFDSLFLT